MQNELTLREMWALAEESVALRAKFRGDGATVFPKATIVGCEPAERSLTLKYMPEPWMNNTMGVLHGGMIATMLDSSMGMTSFCFCKKPTPTVSLTVNFSLPVPLDKPVYVKTTAVAVGKSTIQGMAEMFSPDAPERILAYATGIFRILPNAAFAEGL